MKSKQVAKKLFKRWDDLTDYKKYSNKYISKQKENLWDEIYPLANAYPKLWYVGKRERKIKK